MENSRGVSVLLAAGKAQRRVRSCSVQDSRGVDIVPQNTQYVPRREMFAVRFIVDVRLGEAGGLPVCE